MDALRTYEAALKVYLTPAKAKAQTIKLFGSIYGKTHKEVKRCEKVLDDLWRGKV